MPISAGRAAGARPYSALTQPFPGAADSAGKNPDLVASRSLGFVEGLVGGAQQGVRVRRMGGTQRDPERSGRAKKAVLFAPDGGADFRAPAACALERRLGEHHRELLAAVSAGDVAAANVAFQKRAHLHEHLVACLVAGAVAYP